VKVWQEDQLQALLAIDSEQSLFQQLTHHARKLGFDYCGYGLRMPLPIANPRIVMHSNYPAAWQRRYSDRNYFEVDPTVKHAKYSLLPIVWSDEVFRPVRSLWEEARAFGLKYGWARSSNDMHGVRGMLTVARAAEPLRDAELEHKGLMLDWLTQVAHMAMAHIIVPKLLPELATELSTREISVLRWTAEGKTCSEISDILYISERTVNFHIKNSMIKLNAANKTAATIRAAVLGLLH
jgi:LuxR family transcriptional regulator